MGDGSLPVKPPISDGRAARELQARGGLRADRGGRPVASPLPASRATSSALVAPPPGPPAPDGPAPDGAPAAARYPAPPGAAVPPGPLAAASRAGRRAGQQDRARVRRRGPSRAWKPRGAASATARARRRVPCAAPARSRPGGTSASGAAMAPPAVRGAARAASPACGRAARPPTRRSRAAVHGEREPRRRCAVAQEEGAADRDERADRGRERDGVVRVHDAAHQAEDEAGDDEPAAPEEERGAGRVEARRPPREEEAGGERDERGRHEPADLRAHAVAEEAREAGLPAEAGAAQPPPAGPLPPESRSRPLSPRVSSRIESCREPPMYGRSPNGHHSTSARYGPAVATMPWSPATTPASRRRTGPGRRRARRARAPAGRGTPAASSSGRARSRCPRGRGGGGRRGRARAGRGPGGDDEQQREQGVRAVERK